MGMDIDYVAGKQAIDKLHELLSNTPHGERAKIADDLIEIVELLENRYKKSKWKTYKKIGFQDRTGTEICEGDTLSMHIGEGNDRTRVSGVVTYREDYEGYYLEYQYENFEVLNLLEITEKTLAGAHIIK